MEHTAIRSLLFYQPYQRPASGKPQHIAAQALSLVHKFFYPVKSQLFNQMQGHQVLPIDVGADLRKLQHPPGIIEGRPARLLRLSAAAVFLPNQIPHVNLGKLQIVGDTKAYPPNQGSALLLYHHPHSELI